MVYSPLYFSLLRGSIGLMIGVSKSLLVAGWGDLNDIQIIVGLFHMPLVPLAKGFKYLGFRLKPISYKSGDWLWLLEKFQNRLLQWSNRWLSLSGKLILA